MVTATATFLCSTCSVHYETNRERREHMRSEWHVVNMKRKIAELPAITLRLYEANLRDTREHEEAKCQLSDSLRGRRAKNVEHEGNAEDEANAAHGCLFCPDTTSPTIDHMKASHGFNIPGVDGLATDLDSFLSYLRLVITRFHSCLYCGAQKRSAEAVRAHMRSRGHCMLDLRPGSEFLDFWPEREISDGVGGLRVAENEMRLPSGAMAARQRQTARVVRSCGRKDNEALVVRRQDGGLPEASRPPRPAAMSKTLVLTRDQMGLIGVSDQAQRSLVMLQHKMVGDQLRARNETKWTLEKACTRAKQRKLKMGRTGVHSAVQAC